MSKVNGGETKKPLHCTFCGKSQHEVRKLIAGPTVFICDECVELCMDIIREENKSSLVKSRDGILTPNVWSGRALQENFHRVGGCAVLHQCIRPLTGAFCAPGHHGYQRACDLISGSASTGHWGHQCSHAPGRPILHLVSNPLADLGR